MIDSPMDFERLINPRAVALIGATTNPLRGAYRFLEGWLSNKFQGTIYPINPKYQEILGLKTYSDIREVPGEIDYALIAVPARGVPAEVQKCVEKKVKFIVIFSSGFREAGNLSLENDILRIIKGKARVLGPNCIGVFSTEARLGYFVDQPIGTLGNVSFISQSGGIARKLIWTSISRGFDIRASVSIGNTIDISVSELMKSFWMDPKTQIIAAYLEAIQDGGAFFKLLRKITPEKPVVILKSGRTVKGQVAAQSHTGAIAGSHEIFTAVMKQLGGIVVERFEELTDTVLALQHLRNCLPTGSNVAIINAGGGIAVEITDLCETNGFKVASLTQRTQGKLKELLPTVNTILENPIDLGASGFNPEIYGQVIKLITHDSNINALLVVFEIERFSDLNNRFNIADIGEVYAETLNRFRDPLKPILCILPRSWELIEHFITYQNFQNDLLSVGIPSYPTPIQAIQTLRNLVRYAKFLRRIPPNRN